MSIPNTTDDIQQAIDLALNNQYEKAAQVPYFTYLDINPKNHRDTTSGKIQQELKYNRNNKCTMLLIDSTVFLSYFKYHK